MKAKISTLARKVEDLEGKQLHEVQAVTENPAQANPCINCQSTGHTEEHCPIAPLVRDIIYQSMPMPWANTSHNPMLHMVIHIVPIGRITPISLGNQIPLLMCLPVPNNSLVPHLNHNHHHPLPMWNKLF